jgi:hypothetical protein
LAEALDIFAAFCARGAIAGLLDEGGVYVAEEVVHQVGVVSYDGCFLFLENMMVCEENDPNF